jgi:hypothetical protein
MLTNQYILTGFGCNSIAIGFRVARIIRSLPGLQVDFTLGRCLRHDLDMVGRVPGREGVLEQNRVGMFLTVEGVERETVREGWGESDERMDWVVVTRGRSSCKSE